MSRSTFLPALAFGFAAALAAGALWPHRASAAASPSPEPAAAKPARIAEATFAGGCFWCMESPYLKIKGVTEVLPGYSGGRNSNPTYEEVSGGETGHAESVNV